MSEVTNYNIAIRKRNIVIASCLISVLLLSRPTIYTADKLLSHDHKLPTISQDSDSLPLIKGIDVSHYQGNILWQKVNNDGINFAFVKATEGTRYIDPKFLDNRKGLSKQGIPFGIFHFFKPEESAVEQAEHFIKTTGRKHVLRPVIDIEIQGSTSSKEIREKVKVWLDKVEKEIGCTPIIYTDKYYWEENLGDQFNQYPLWIAEYRKHLTLPKNVQQWAFWQNSDKGKVDGIRSFVDTDIFFSGKKEFEKYLCQ